MNENMKGMLSLVAILLAGLLGQLLWDYFTINVTAHDKTVMGAALIICVVSIIAAIFAYLYFKVRFEYFEHEEKSNELIKLHESVIAKLENDLEKQQG